MQQGSLTWWRIRYALLPAFNRLIFTQQELHPNTLKNITLSPNVVAFFVAFLFLEYPQN